MEIQTATGTKSSRIASKLEEMILNNELKAGEFLPSQHEVANRFGASSRSVREAYKHLEAKGLVQIHQGRKAEIKANNLDQFVESLSNSIIRNQANNKKLVLDLLQVRITVSTSAARQFSRNPDRKEIVNELREQCQSMTSLLPDIQKKEPNAVDRFMQFDGRFHSIIVRSNGNQILNAIYEYLSPLLQQNLRVLKFTYSELEKRVRDYVYLCDALQNGQTDLAVALMLVSMTSLKSKIVDKFPEKDAAYA